MRIGRCLVCGDRTYLLEDNATCEPCMEDEQEYQSSLDPAGGDSEPEEEQRNG